MNEHPYIPPEPQIHLPRPVNPWGLAMILACAVSAVVVVLGILFAAGML